MKRIFLIVGITAGCVIIAAVVVFYWSSAQSPAPAVAGPPPPPAIDVAALKARAGQGDAAAQVQLARAFEDGDGVPRNSKLAAQWCGLAASNGNAEAEAMMGELCQVGQGVPRDLTNAVRWFTTGRPTRQRRRAIRPWVHV